MHTPQHLLNEMTSLTTDVVAVTAVALAVRHSRAELRPRGAGRGDVTGRVTMASGVTALIFAAQMLNFPIASGTSGHLIGAALATALLGPWTAVLSMTTVLTVQAVVFADGSLPSLGTNVLTMAVVAVAVAAAVQSAAARVGAGRISAARSRSGAVVVAAVGAALSVPVAAVALAGLFAVGGTSSASAVRFATQMVTVHLVIGVGEAVITAVLVAAALALAPQATQVGRAMGIQARRGGAGGELGLAAGLVAMVVAGAGARFASASPDGLDFVAHRLGINLVGSTGAPLADYGAVVGVDVGLAGVIGVVLVGLVAWAGTRAMAAGLAGSEQPVAR